MLIKQIYSIPLDGNHQQVYQLAVSGSDTTLDSLDIKQKKSDPISDIWRYLKDHI